MCWNYACGYFDAEDSKEARMENRKVWNAQRTIAYKNGTYSRDGGVMDVVTDDAPQFVKDYNDI